MMKMRIKDRPTGRCLLRWSGASVLLVFLSAAPAQVFTYKDSDLCLGFRKVTPYTENNEVVINIGQASNYVNAAIGTTLPVTAYTASQLVPGSFTTANNLSWSVTGWFVGPNSSYPGYPAYTVWLTVPRFDNAVRSADANRQTGSGQQVIKSKMSSILLNAGFISRDIGNSNAFNTATFIRESIGTYSTHLMSVWMKSLVDSTIGSLNDTWTDNNLEAATPDTFSGVSRSDLYEVRPLDDGRGNDVVDPHTGTTGLAYYVGYFEFKSDGTMTFTREDVNLQPAPPPPPTLTIRRTNNVSTISFVSSNSATYTLFFTNAGGLGAPVTNWPSLPANILGSGGATNFQDTTTDPNRFYRVQGH